MRTAPLFAVVATLGCAPPEITQPQLLVVVDTDLPTTFQALEEPRLSRDAAVDTLRVEVRQKGELIDRRAFLVPSPLDWPVSFGLPAEAVPAGPDVQLRIMLFQNRFATTSEDGLPVPLPATTVDRLVEVTLSDDGLLEVGVMMAGDCLGTPARAFPTDGSPPTSCVGGNGQRSPRTGIELGPDVATEGSRVGTWSPAMARACEREAPEGTVCIPGGFHFIGDTRFVQVADTFVSDALPLRPVVVSPFFIDRTEMTLAQLEQLVARGDYGGPLPAVRGDTQVVRGEDCTFETNFAGDPGLPVNCISYETAEALCQARGGTLPSEAQWSFAARGRGQRRLYPWGDAPFDCCMASVGRDEAASCGGAGVEPAGSHPPEACGGLGDVTRDGVVDMAGSLTEPIADDFASLSAPCWPHPDDGIPVDPVCRNGALNRASRGGYYAAGVAFAAVPWRQAFGAGPASGVRCVYRNGDG